MHRVNSFGPAGPRGPILMAQHLLLLTHVHNTAQKPVQAMGYYLVEGGKTFDHGNSAKGSW
jgi:hypothetical protein